MRRQPRNRWLALFVSVAMMVGLLIALPVVPLPGRPAQAAKAADGDVVWSKTLGEVGTVTVAPGSQVISRACYTPSSGIVGLQAFTPAGGLEWSSADDGSSSQGPTCHPQTVVDNRSNSYRVVFNGTEYLIEALNNGAVRWSVPIESTCSDHHMGVALALAVGTDGNVYATAVVTGSSCGGDEYYLIGLAASDGHYLVRQQFSSFIPDGGALFTYSGGLAVMQGPEVRYYSYSGTLQHDYTLPAASYSQTNLRSIYAAGSDGTAFVGSYYFSQYGGLDCSSQNAVITKVTPSGGAAWTRQYATSTTCKTLGALRALPNGGVTAVSYPALDLTSPSLLGVASDNSSTWTKSLVASASGESITYVDTVAVDTSGTIVVTSKLEVTCSGLCDGVQIDRYAQSDGSTVGSSIVLDQTGSNPGSYSLTGNVGTVAIDSDRVYLSIYRCDDANQCSGRNPTLDSIVVSGLDPDYPSSSLISQMPNSPFPGQLSYVALGDSVPSGEGINYGWYWDNSSSSWKRPDSTDPAWQDSSIAGQACHVSFGGYPHYVAAAKNLSLTDLACTGASAMYPSFNYPPGGVLVKEKFYDPDTHDVTATADVAQLGSSSVSGADAPNSAYDSAQPDIVTLTLGADDVDFGKVVRSCYSPLWAAPYGACTTTDANTAIAGFLDAEKTKLHSVLTEIQSRGNAAGKVPHVYLTNYYDPFPATYDSSCKDISPVETGDLTSGEMSWLQDKLGALNDNIQAEADLFPSMVTLVDLHDVMAGHTLCTSEPWLYGPSIAVPSAQRNNPAPFHPTPAGQQKIAETIESAITEGTNYVTNGSFEAGSATGWNATNTPSVTTSQAHLGTHSGPRQSAGLAGSRACDAEEWQDSGGVAGVAAQRGGDVAVAVGPEDADGEVAQAGHGSGGGAGADLGGVLGEGGVADVVQRLDAPVAPDPVSQAGGVGLGGGEVGDRVDGDGAPAWAV